MSSARALKQFLDQHVGGTWHPRGTPQTPSETGMSPSGTLTDPIDSITGFYCDAMPDRLAATLGLTLKDTYNANVDVLPPARDHTRSIEMPLADAIALSRNEALKKATTPLPHAPTTSLVSSLRTELGLEGSRGV